MPPDRLPALRAALGFLALAPREPELQLLHRCFDTWRGIGDVVAGMARQDFRVSLVGHGAGQWIDVFYARGGQQPAPARPFLFTLSFSAGLAVPGPSLPCFSDR